MKQFKFALIKNCFDWSYVARMKWILWNIEYGRYEIAYMHQFTYIFQFIEIESIIVVT